MKETPFYKVFPDPNFFSECNSARDSIFSTVNNAVALKPHKTNVGQKQFYAILD